MKKQAYLFLFVMAILVSCENLELNNFPQNSNQVEFCGFRVNLPANHNEQILSLSLSDLQKEYYSHNSKGIMRMKSSRELGFTLEQISEISDKILTQYPNIDSLNTEEIAKIKINFSDLSTDDIIENINVIDSFYTSFIRYDLVQTLSKIEHNESNKIKTSKVSSNHYYYDYPYHLSSSEFWYLIKHPRNIKPIKKAKEKAEELTNENYKGMSKSRTIADAFRHTVWNILICKYVGKYKSKIKDCVKVAKDFTTKHETDASKPQNLSDKDWKLDKEMDLHNNEQGRKYFREKAWKKTHRLWFGRKRTKVKAPSENQIVIEIKEKINSSAKKIINVNDSYKYPNNIVYIKD
ncbi:MAG: hypothetical protein CR965_00825 [Paludibacter sp.]|nr:MAG: hypothetical protein CR965_00825 [Paludibacter sp.]